MSDQPVPDPIPAAPTAVPAAGPGDVQDPVATLSARLGQPLADRATALASLTHKSYVNEHRDEGLGDNERLEFLGDAVIDLAVSHRLMERFPAAREGDLSKMRASVVDEAGLAALARSIDLGGLLRLGRGEELTGGRRKASLLADAMEAVVAAVYLEAGLPGVLGLVDRHLGEAFAKAAAGTLDRDYKTQLQETAQARLRATPRYRVVAELGPDHAKVFDVELEVKGEALGRATGRSKKDAEQAAARVALDALARRAAAAAAAAALPEDAGTCSPAGSPAPVRLAESVEPLPPAVPAVAADDREAVGEGEATAEGAVPEAARPVRTAPRRKPARTTKKKAAATTRRPPGPTRKAAAAKTRRARAAPPTRR
jgi:ribonuclease-3